MREIVKQGWSEKEMSDALDKFLTGTWTLCIPPQRNDPDLVIAGTIDEVLALRAEVTKLRAVVEAAREYRDASEANRRAALQLWTDENRVIIAGRVSAARDALFATLDQAPPKGGE